MLKETITRAEYLQLVGLDALARHHSSKMNDLRHAMYELLGTSDEEDNRGWIDDLLWASNQVSVDMALKGLGVEVVGAINADP